MPMSLNSLPLKSQRQIEEEKTRIPTPSHRHAAPSAPWPWIDIPDEVDERQLASKLPPVPPLCDHKTCNGCWTRYPQSRFPNWTNAQVKKSKIYDAINYYNRSVPCVIYQLDVNNDGFFEQAETLRAAEGDDDVIWDSLINAKRPDGLRVRGMFIQDLSGPVLQMLGASYNIEPFFFSSSLNWIPSRFQEEINPGEGDHITVTLRFLRSTQDEQAVGLGALSNSPYSASSDTLAHKERSILISQMIDTQAPLSLKSCNRHLVLDLLSVHLIRKKKGSTFISYHPSLLLQTTTAKFLHKRIRFAGQSVYWQSIFQKSSDPTFVVLVMIWHALYAWDEALENLYSHICDLEMRVITTSEMNITQELHVIRAHHLHYSSLLEDFTKTVEFIRDTPNPAAESFSEEDRNFSEQMLKRECNKLLGEIDRLELGRRMQDKRLKNVMNLVFSSVNILDSKRMQKMTEAAVRDSAGMKQIAYLTMIFLPASFVAGVFGMNIQEVAPGTSGTLGHYVGAAIPMTIVSIWIIIAFQSRYIFPDHVSFMVRLAWPVLLILRMFGKDPYAPKKADKGNNGYTSINDGMHQLRDM